MTKDKPDKKLAKEQLLLEAARLGRFDELESVLGQSPMQRFKKKSNPLASLRKQLGPNSVRDPATGFTCLHHAALNGHGECVRLILSHGAKVNALDYKGSSALHLAAWAGNLEVIRILLAYSASLADFNRHQADSQQQQQQHYGWPWCELAGLQLEPVELDLRNNDNQTALSLAAQFGHAHVLAELLRAGASVRGRNSRLESALDLACLCGRAETARLLLDSSPDLRAELRRDRALCWWPVGPLGSPAKPAAAPSDDGQQRSAWASLKRLGGGKQQRACDTPSRRPPSRSPSAVGQQQQQQQQPQQVAGSPARAWRRATLALGAPLDGASQVDQSTAPGQQLERLLPLAPLHCATKRGHAALISELLQKYGANLLQVTSAGGVLHEIALNNGKHCDTIGVFFQFIAQYLEPQNRLELVAKLVGLENAQKLTVFQLCDQINTRQAQDLKRLILKLSDQIRAQAGALSSSSINLLPATTLARNWPLEPVRQSGSSQFGHINSFVTMKRAPKRQQTAADFQLHQQVAAPSQQQQQPQVASRRHDQFQQLTRSVSNLSQHQPSAAPRAYNQDFLVATQIEQAVYQTNLRRLKSRSRDFASILLQAQQQQLGRYEPPLYDNQLGFAGCATPLATNFGQLVRSQTDCNSLVGRTGGVSSPERRTQINRHYHVYEHQFYPPRLAAQDHSLVAVVAPTLRNTDDSPHQHRPAELSQREIGAPRAAGRSLAQLSSCSSFDQAAGAAAVDSNQFESASRAFLRDFDQMLGREFALPRSSSSLSRRSQPPASPSAFGQSSVDAHQHQHQYRKSTVLAAPSTPPRPSLLSKSQFKLRQSLCDNQPAAIYDQPTCQAGATSRLQASSAAAPTQRPPPPPPPPSCASRLTTTPASPLRNKPASLLSSSSDASCQGQSHQPVPALRPGDQDSGVCCGGGDTSSHLSQDSSLAERNPPSGHSSKPPELSIDVRPQPANCGEPDDQASSPPSPNTAQLCVEEALGPLAQPVLLLRKTDAGVHQAVDWWLESAATSNEPDYENCRQLEPTTFAACCQTEPEPEPAKDNDDDDGDYAGSAQDSLSSAGSSAPVGGSISDSSGGGNRRELTLRVLLDDTRGDSEGAKIFYLDPTELGKLGNRRACMVDAASLTTDQDLSAAIDKSSGYIRLTLKKRRTEPESTSTSEKSTDTGSPATEPTAAGETKTSKLVAAAAATRPSGAGQMAVRRHSELAAATGATASRLEASNSLASLAANQHQHQHHHQQHQLEALRRWFGCNLPGLVEYHSRFVLHGLDSLGFLNNPKLLDDELLSLIGIDDHSHRLLILETVRNRLAPVELETKLAQSKPLTVAALLQVLDLNCYNSASGDQNQDQDWARLRSLSKSWPLGHRRRLEAALGLASCDLLRNSRAQLSQQSSLESSSTSSSSRASVKSIVSAGGGVKLEATQPEPAQRPGDATSVCVGGGGGQDTLAREFARRLEAANDDCVLPSQLRPQLAKRKINNREPLGDATRATESTTNNNNNIQQPARPANKLAAIRLSYERQIEDNARAKSNELARLAKPAPPAKPAKLIVASSSASLQQRTS